MQGEISPRNVAAAARRCGGGGKIAGAGTCILRATPASASAASSVGMQLSSRGITPRREAHWATPHSSGLRSKAVHPSATNCVHATMHPTSGSAEASQPPSPPPTSFCSRPALSVAFWQHSGARRPISLRTPRSAGSSTHAPAWAPGRLAPGAKPSRPRATSWFAVWMRRACCAPLHRWHSAATASLASSHLAWASAASCSAARAQ